MITAIIILTLPILIGLTLIAILSAKGKPQTTVREKINKER